ncbi:MAG TPA: SPFH domain-containing protein [Ktedonobacteraceae bacterium]|nr:SPFH domain-containing protein [Ktedonobacteraceae bacterium]
MPSDQDENRAVRQNASAMEWEQPIVPNDQSMAHVPFEEDSQFMDEVSDTDNLLTPDTESDLLQWTRPALVSKETLGTFARQFSPVLIPLPFALLVFLFTLPATLQGPPAHPSLLVMGILLLALMILQGTLLYFAGSNDTLWLLYIALGYALFIIGGVFGVLGPMAALITLGVLVLLGLILAQRSIHPTKEGHVDLVESFGKYTHTLYPGLNLLMPWEKVVRRLNNQETTWTCPQQRVPTSREQDVQLTATISYQLLPEDAHLAALTVKNWEGSLQTLFVGTVQSLVNELTAADFVAWTQSIYTRASSDANSFNPTAATRWDRINTTLSRRMQDQVAAWGVQVNWVRIQDITLLPHTHGGPAAFTGNETGGTTQMMQPEPASTQAAPASRPPVKAELAQSTPPTTERAANAPTNAAGTLPKIETLRDMYNVVRQGVITDPAVILDIAQRFESLANDPVASKTIDFDAARAATTLRQRAQKLQELAQARAAGQAATSNQTGEAR